MTLDYTVHGILQARILEWAAFPFSRGFSQPRDQTQVSHIAGRFFASWATGEAQFCARYYIKHFTCTTDFNSEQLYEVGTIISSISQVETDA